MARNGKKQQERARDSKKRQEMARNGKIQQETARYSMKRGEMGIHGRKSKETRRNGKRKRMKTTNSIDVNKITQRLWRGRARRQENKQ